MCDDDGKKSTFDLFCEVSTCMGIIDWYNAKHKVGKFFWAVLVAASVAVTVWQTQGVISEFVTRTPYQTSVSHRPVENGTQFPNITICNFNRAKQSLINETDVNPKVLEYAFQLLLAPYPLSLLTYADFINLTEYEVEWEKHANKYNYDSVKDFYRHYGHDYNDTVYATNIGSGPFPLPYEEVWTLYGRCFKVISGTQRQKTAGSNAGITFVLNPLMIEYMTNQVVNNFVQEGLILLPDYNHQPLMPVPLFVPTGVYAGVSLKAKREVTVIESTPLLPPDCQRDATLSILNEAYTPQNCMYDCYLQLVFNACGCVILASTKPDYPICNLTTCIQCASPVHVLNMTIMAAIDMQSKNSKYVKNDLLVQEFDTCTNRCNKPCDDFLSVEASMTTTTGISRSLRSSFFAKFGIALPSNATPYVDDFMQNVISVNFYFSTPGEVVITTDESIPLFTFIGNIGGQLGLWIGMSMLTLVQCLYYFVVACLKGEIYRRRKTIVDSASSVIVNQAFCK